MIAHQHCKGYIYIYMHIEDIYIYIYMHEKV